MESALVSPDTVALSRDALQLTWLCRKGAKVWHARTIRSVHPTIASLESAKSSMSHQAPHRAPNRTLNLSQTCQPQLSFH